MLMPQMIDTLNRNHAAIGHKPDDLFAEAS